jgi:PAS domain S-box-containing protein
LRGLGVLDTPAEPEFDRIVSLARIISGAQSATISLIDEHRQWFKAKVGLAECETPRDVAFCAHTILSSETLWVEDARQDSRFSDNPHVEDAAGVRFYAGAPILHHGQRVGTVCVFDPSPRAFDPQISEALGHLARSAADALEVRRLSQLELKGRNILAATSDAVICAGASGLIDYWNPAAERTFGWTAEEAIGRPLELIVPTRLKEAHNAGFLRRVAGGAPRLGSKAVELPALHKNGHEFPVELTLSTWPTSEGLEMGAIIRDISERKQADEELRRTRVEMEIASRETAAARETMALVVRSATLPLVMTDRDMRILEVSDRWVEHYNVPRTDAVGWLIHEVFPSVAETWDPVYRRCLEGASERGRSSSRVGGEGVERWFQWEVAPWRDATGAVAGLLLSSHDVSDLMGAKRLLELDRRRLDMAVDIADLVVWEADFQSQRLHVHGGDPEVLLGHPVDYAALARDQFMIVHPDDKLRAKAAWRRHLEHGQPYQVEHRLPRTDKEVWVSSTVELVRDTQGEPKAVLGVVTDITGRKTLELEARRAHEAADAANRVKTQFLANMSHEVRTPLNGVLGLAGVLDATRLDSEQRAMIRMIEASGRELEHMLTGMLDLVRLDGGAGETLAEPLDLAELVRDAAGRCAAAAARKGLEVRVEIASGGADTACLGDADRIRQALDHLADNAVKFTDRGWIVFGLDLAPVGGGVRARLSVADTGAGFDPERAETLFERFSQADNANTRRHGGSGLGLPICRALAAAMGGSVEARSVPGQGSTFSLVLDLSVQPRAMTAAA